MGITERKERERQEMRQLILNTAMKLFLEEGYDNVTIRKIARMIEYSPATIYLYFADKDEIFYALCTMAFEKFHESLQPLLAIKDPFKRLRKGGEAYIEFALENQEYYDLMFIMRSPARKMTGEKEWRLGRRSYEMLRANIKECIAAGQLPAGTDIEGATFAMWSFIHGVTSLVIRRRVGVIPEKKLRSTLNSALNFMMNQLKGKS